MPVAVVLNVTPLVAIAPALVVAFGFGPEPKLIVTGLICFFPILINTAVGLRAVPRSEEHTSELQSLMRISYAVFCLNKKTLIDRQTTPMRTRPLKHTHYKQ